MGEPCVRRGRRSEGDARHERIGERARLAGADDFIRELPDGYDTLLGEHGFSLSGGQRQRLAIARAILADPRVLILDDATSAVDPTKEHEIRAALAEVMQGRTTLIIAHRPATIALADRVVLMDDGRPRRGDRHARATCSPRARQYRQVLADDLRAAGGRRDDREPDARRRRRLDADRRSTTTTTTCPRRPTSARRTLRLLRPWRWKFVAVSFFILGQAALMIAGPALISYGIDEGVCKGDVDAVTLAALLFVVAAAGAYVLGRAAILGVAKIGEAFLLDLRSRVFHHIMDLSMGFFDRTRTGLLVSRMTADVEALQDLVGQGLAVFLVSVSLIVGTIVAMFLLSWQLALVTLPMMPILDRGDGLVPAHVESRVPARPRSCRRHAHRAAGGPRGCTRHPGVRPDRSHGR